MVTFNTVHIIPALTHNYSKFEVYSLRKSGHNRSVGKITKDNGTGSVVLYPEYGEFLDINEVYDIYTIMKTLKG